jgi:hypothetical protein
MQKEKLEIKFAASKNFFPPVACVVHLCAVGEA